MPGNDVESFRKIRNAAECQTLCQSNDECYYWTVSKNGDCYLKNANAISAISKKKGATSGPKICRKYLICFLLILILL